MSEDNPKNLREWLLRLKKHESRIFAREKVGEKWDAVPLTELSPEKWAEYVSRWIEEGSLPVYVRAAL